jgi:hypothetical protein
MHVRVDNASGTLPGYIATPRFAVNVYAGHYSGNASTATTSIAMNGSSEGLTQRFAGRRRAVLGIGLHRHPHVDVNQDPHAPPAGELPNQPACQRMFVSLT